MSNLLNREALEKLTKPEILEHIRKRGLKGYSNLNKPELINFYLNPPIQTSIRSPGRPPGSGATKSPGKEKGKGRAVSSQSKSKTVEYSKEGLSNLTSKQLLVLVGKKNVTGYSGKSKGQVVDLLLSKPHRDVLELSFEKEGVADRIIITPTALSRVIPDVAPVVSGAQSVSTGQAVISNAQIMLPQEAFQSSQIRVSPRNVVSSMPFVQTQQPFTQARVSPRGLIPNMPLVQVQPLSQARVSPRGLVPNMPLVQQQPLSQVRVSPRGLSPTMPLVQQQPLSQVRQSPTMPLFQQ